MDGYAGSWANCFWWGGGLMRYKEWMDMLGVGLIVFGGGGGELMRYKEWMDMLGVGLIVFGGGGYDAV